MEPELEDRPTGIARFGDFEFDLGHPSRGSGGLRLPDQSLPILAMLLGCPSELVLSTVQ
jgi:hypothetical protein